MTGWLRYSEDEVRRFHPEFESAANEALRVAGLDGTHEWIHHPRVSGGTVIPDFVLSRKAGGQWVLAFEVKRTRSAVYSTRFQVQAKGYAEAYQHLYAPTAPCFFAISNLEVTMLFALNGNRPAVECRLAQHDGVFESGNFDSDPRADHRRRFVEGLARAIEVAAAGRPPVFDVVWPGVLSDFVSHVEALLGLTPSSESVPTGIGISEPSTPNWPLVRNYFGGSSPVDSARVFLLRCLMVEYLRGTLAKHGHRLSGRIPRLRIDRIQASVANAIDALRTVDFLAVFEDSAADAYRALGHEGAREVLTDYVRLLIDSGRGVSEAARTRVDSPLLVDSLMSTIHPLETQGERGKISTDPDLAALLAHLTIPSREGGSSLSQGSESVTGGSDSGVLDPCCGDGALLSAAYDRLLDLGSVHEEAIASLAGVEADPVAARLACVRLALKQPASLAPNPPISVDHADMFASAATIEEADVVLMNPPFRRYEAQDHHPVPPALRTYYDEAIRTLDGAPPRTTGQQANLFNSYVEYVAKAVSEDTRVGVILDNKWYHNGYGKRLRELLLERFEIECIVEYPHQGFFSGFTIATSMLVARRTGHVDPGHRVKFVRCEGDPRGADLAAVAKASLDAGEWPHGWRCLEGPQSDLDAKDGWKGYFSAELANDFRREDWPTLDGLFESARRGSLNKEEGGIGVLEFPFGRVNFGKRRLVKPQPKRPFQTLPGRSLTQAENQRLASLARSIPNGFRGLAIKNSGQLNGYEFADPDVEIQQTFEPPLLRANPALFTGERRSDWTESHDAALAEMRANPDVDAFVSEIEATANLTEHVLPREQLWVALREPFAGELIIPRKTRSGHRVHVNPYAFDPGGRQVRVSSNFLSYKGCRAADADGGLGRAEAVRLVAAFLVSSFGQLQFEMEGVNREGLLSLEKEQLARVRVFDPRWVRPGKRRPILDAFSRLPYPVRTNRLSFSQPERNALDEFFAEEISAKHPGFDASTLLAEVHEALDEWLEARQP